MLTIAAILGIISSLCVIVAWVVDEPSWAVAGVCIAFAALLFISVGMATRDEERRSAFMTECLMEHKQYECTALWRGGQRNVVAMPVMVPR